MKWYKLSEKKPKRPDSCWVTDGVVSVLALWEPKMQAFGTSMNAITHWAYAIELPDEINNSCPDECGCDNRAGNADNKKTEDINCYYCEEAITTDDFAVCLRCDAKKADEILSFENRIDAIRDALDEMD